MATGMTVWAYRSPVAADDLNLNFALLNLAVMARGGQNLSGTLKVWAAGEDPASVDLNRNFALLEAQIVALGTGGTVTPPVTNHILLHDGVSHVLTRSGAFLTFR